jgi:hypothetical protein
VEVLEHAGYQVLVPEATLCCGRPLYDFGMLDLARHKLAQILTALRPQISADIPIVGLEPSCVSIFRDEMKSLLPHNSDAQRMSRKTFTLSEFLMKEAHYVPPQLHGTALVHGHCHDKSILEFKTQVQLLQKMGLQVETPETGCCGIAGSFGFEKGDRYRVSVKCGERVLLPKVRESEYDTLIVADGFSCRTQIMQGTKRRPIHHAQVLQIGLANEQRLAEGRSRSIRVPFDNKKVPVFGPTEGMITGDHASDHRNSTFASVGIAAGSIAGGLVLAYLANRYLRGGISEIFPVNGLRKNGSALRGLGRQVNTRTGI